MHAAEALASQIEASQYTLSANLAGVDAAGAINEPPGGGASLQWKLTHLLSYRRAMLGMLGQTTGNHAEDEGFEDTLEALAVTAELLVEALRAGPELLDAAGPDGQGRVGDGLAGLVFHDAYHAGQLGSGRRSLGLPGAL